MEAFVGDAFNVQEDFDRVFWENRGFVEVDLSRSQG